LNELQRSLFKQKNVQESLYHGLRDHIEQLLRAYRAKEGDNNKEKTRKMPHPGYPETKKQKAKIKRREKKMKLRSKNRLLKMLRKEQRREQRKDKP